MNKVPEVYCELGAVTPRLTALQHRGALRLVHRPVDVSRSRKVKPTAAPSASRWEDDGTLWDEDLHTWESAGSKMYEAILKIVGNANRRDALHVDSAFITGCICLVTEDRDILDVKTALYDLLGLRIYSGTDEELYHFIPK